MSLNHMKPHAVGASNLWGGKEGARGLALFCAVSTAELLRLVPRLVSKELWKALQQVQDDRLGGPLKALMEAVKERLPRDPGDDDETLSQLRIARLALVAKTVRPP